MGRTEVSNCLTVVRNCLVVVSDRLTPEVRNFVTVVRNCHVVVSDCLAEKRESRLHRMRQEEQVLKLQHPTLPNLIEKNVSFKLFGNEVNYTNA